MKVEIIGVANAKAWAPRLAAAKVQEGEQLQ
jgi:hypothetical protein